MAVDMHRHLFTRSERYYGLHVAGLSSASEPSKDERVPNATERGREVIAEMEAAGVSASVILVDDFTARDGEGNFSIEGENRRHAELSKLFPGKFISFAGIDPRRPRALELFRKAIDEWGVRGLKLNCGVGYHPSDACCLPMYELAGQRGVPVLFHTGPAPAPSCSEPSRPIHLDAVAAQFPNTTFIMGHAGQEAWWLEALSIAHWKHNVILELSGWQHSYLFSPRDFVSVIAKMKYFVGISRIIWGSDFPFYRDIMSLKDWVNAFRGLPALARTLGYSISDEDIDAILMTNPERILGLKQG